MEHNSRMKEITGNLKQDVKDLLGESASLFTGFFKRGACTVRAVADKWKAFAHDISAAVDDLMKPPFAEGGPEAPMVSLDPEGEPIVTVMESMDERFPIGKQMSLSQAEEYVRQVDQEYREAERTPQAVKVKIDYMKDGRTDRYWLPLEIGAGGSLLEQMQTHVLFSVIKDTRSTSGIVDLVTNVDYVPLVNHYLEQRGYPAPAQEQGEEAPKKAAPRARPEHSSPQRGSGSTARQTRSTDTGTTETTEKPSVKSRLEALRAASEGMREPGRAPQAKGKTIPKSR